MIELTNIGGMDMTSLVFAFQRAFADYPVSFSADEIHSMLRRRGYCGELSFGAIDNGELVAFALNGIGDFRGVKTAYDTGTGTAPEYRGQGIAQRLLRHAFPSLAEAGVGQYLLEVLTDNAPAVKLYRGEGFEIVREFTCHGQQTTDIVTGSRHTSEIELRQLDACHHVAEGEDFCDFLPSWQNSFTSIMRAGSELYAIGAFHGEKMVGYAVSNLIQGDLTQIAVDPVYRGVGIGSMLLDEIVARNRAPRLKVLNVETSCNTLPDFLSHRNIPVLSRQYEMVRTLR